MKLPPVLVLFLLLVACGGAFTPVPGAGGLFQDAGIFEPVKDLISSARSTVLVEMYEFGRSDLERAVIAASRRNVGVRIVLDPTVSPSVATGRRLLAAGVPVRFYPVDDQAGQIDHVKLLIADADAVVGGMNWGAASARNHDYALLLRGPADLNRLRLIFEQDWSLAGGTPAPLPAAAGGSPAQTAPGAEIRTLVEGALSGAHRRIEAELFDLTDPEVLLELQLARRRGVAVRVILDPGQSVNQAAFSRLRGSGVAVRWASLAPGAKLHAKAVLVDDRLVLGSANWSRHGFDINHELDVATAECQAVTAYEARFEDDWKAASA